MLNVSIVFAEYAFFFELSSMDVSEWRLFRIKYESVIDRVEFLPDTIFSRVVADESLPGANYNTQRRCNANTQAVSI